MSPLTFSYLAKVQPKEENKALSFDEAWSKCAGKYPYRVMAIDGSVNRNGWGIKAERLAEFAKKMAGIQTRKDHGDTVDSVVGKLEETRFDEGTGQVFGEGWTHERELAKRIHMGTVTDVSMQARAKDIECGNCGKQMDACSCSEPWKSLLNPEPVEISFVAEGAYVNAGVVAGFYAALDKEVTAMSKLEDIEKELLALKAKYSAADTPLPTSPAPTKTDDSPKKKQGGTPADDDPTVTDKTEKAAEELAPETKKHMKEDIEEMKDIKASLAALTAELEKLRKGEDKEEGKKASAAPDTSASFQSRRSQPGPEGSTQTFKASAGGNATMLSFKDYQAALDQGKDPYAGVPKATSPYVDRVRAMREQGWDNDQANLMADIQQAYEDIASKTTVRHITYGGGK